MIRVPSLLLLLAAEFLRCLLSGGTGLVLVLHFGVKGLCLVGRCLLIETGELQLCRRGGPGGRRPRNHLPLEVGGPALPPFGVIKTRGRGFSQIWPHEF